MKHNKVKNPKWQEANQLAMYNHAQEVELGYQIQVRAKVGREKGAYCALIAWSRYLIGENGH